MASERAIRANRVNAMASTGPRTREGKMRSGKNARKHGLSASGQTPEAKAEVARLVELIIAEYGADEVIREAARSFAEAQLQVRSARAFKATLVESIMLANSWGKELDSRHSVEILLEATQIHEYIERYERRSFSRRKSAVRRFFDLSNGTDQSS